ncbi:hypothetical protein ACLHDG_06755 [Sulfurovum sp. CS9]|uniref:hypothetical protein n=1 Tax=Sulfurovum sp. CS9 TaxID=3391146 RepID=UPI0039EB0A16
MANRLENRVKKLEQISTAGKMRLVIPWGAWYDDSVCESYWTNEPFNPITLTLADFYREVTEENCNGK